MTGHELLLALAPAAPLAGGFLDFVNGKLGDLSATVRAFVSVVAVVMFVIVAVRSRLQLAPTVLALLGAAAIIWLASGGGLEWFAGLLGREFGGSA
ncbi:MAG: hypothetical protein Q4E05_09000 [Pseudoclavibacter sp.]|nr:hypothetical protein [Pseudoclavibacter sp.]